MSNRQQRRASGKESGSKVIRPKPGVNDTMPMMSVFAENGAVVLHLAYGDAWIMQVKMSVADAEGHLKEFTDVLRGLKSGLIVPNKPSGLIVPGQGES